ncbi:DUF2591 domain-containing protein [Photorhabdus laumondii subsp. laumondii]|uniref:Photorhabdus luminescens subsp. laumondii TTO1 complete genome segment 10/17 n=2 Tax=Photorhabdus laumondii subsp. laumondii TaxID=141679 RepID=Q7N311_PHOLL|nr:DUF2591 domain-containing protein [Photorhabdus laumondii]AWK42620.1 hypothetical protein A4R40_14530 [Photorhabdus laumondii subsp. laumondii]AXG47945.1 DUF2591 domain-containing protein [Photorhabdus laumondii subsp. laumondii]MCC8384601.1 DUF2591 domain-containing protein [Photorhabdus laumondii]MCC8413353.1 DUF2591 domain-containing protein [Photorhabdus laumondii]NDK95018.1 DUF2591 domain-containing protein [Photorhabdus laumondii subsp. laumondii]
MKNKYSELSDFEINKLVLIQESKESLAEIINIRQRNHVFRIFHRQVIADVKFKDESDFSEIGPFDFCNNPSDAWNIIVKNKISLVYVNDFWSARQYHNACIEVNDKNPLKAAMIVFLMMSKGATSV